MLPEMRRWTCRVVHPEKRILMLWDFRSQPYSIGDLLILQGLSVVLCAEHEVDAVDICLLADPSCPARPSFRELDVDESNYMASVLSLIPVALIGDRVADLHLFSSVAAIEDYVADHAHRYHIWPSGYDFGSKIDLARPNMRQVAAFHARHGHVPELVLRKSLLAWGRSFMSRHARGRVPFVVQIRNAGAYNPTRNSRMDAWLALFRFCQERFPVMFFVVCSRQEVDDRLRTVENVVVAKDHGTTVDQDLALISCSAAFMGMSSGPSSLVWFSKKPYSVANVHVDPFACEGWLVPRPWGFGIVFGTEQQRFLTGAETEESLIGEFRRLYAAIDADSWVRHVAVHTAATKGAQGSGRLRIR
ncbi:MAG: hypothetical protein JXQ75_13965 [Phycisphaerae bacterium]|nr:hypothetical protein [Phycisphaerae bacterium]